MANIAAVGVAPAASVGVNPSLQASINATRNPNANRQVDPAIAQAHHHHPQTSAASQVATNIAALNATTTLGANLNIEV